MDIWWTLHLKRDPASVPLARRILLGAMDTAGVDPQIAHDLGVALSEACANAVEHAVGEGFQITASLEGDRLRIEVTDSGPGLPAVAAAPSPLPRLRRPAPAAPPRPAVHRRTRRGRASLPAPVPTRPRPAGPYDTHVLPLRRPAATRTPEFDGLPDLFAESGRGLFLIHALTDHVQLHNHPLRGATVSFDKQLKWQDRGLFSVAS
ncbi:ATP-binding protein [Kitasatospora sp. NPDC002227]|uniref:ATP-binding protein n=1 Tax=Kitasatospora sp. NPDC002227 TaxID=3154773 RepID=UPI003316EFB9